MTKGCRSCRHYLRRGGLDGGWACDAIGDGGESPDDWIDAVTGADGGRMPDDSPCPVPTDDSCPRKERR